MHLLEAAGARFLLDAGLFQGHRAEAQELNARLPFDPRRLDGVVLSHAHIDHTGRLPLLVRHGFHGPIYATPATRDLCAVMLPDAAHIQEKDSEFLRAARQGRRRRASRSTRMADAVAVQDLMVGVPYRRITHLRKHLALEFLDAGHILGSASVDLRITEGGNHRLVFSGDIGRSGTADHPRSRAAVRADRHADRRVHLRRPRPRVGGRRRGAAGRGGPADRRARRQGAHPRLRAGPGPGAGLRPAPALAARARSPRSRSTSTARSRWTPPPCSGCIPEVFDHREQLIASREPDLRLPPGALRARRRGVQGAQQPAAARRSSSRPRAWRSRDGSSTTSPTASATTATWCSSSASRPSTRWAGGSRRATRSSGSSARSTPVAPRSRRIGGYSAHADRERAARLGPPAGRTDPAGVRGARRAARASRRWPRSSGRRACARSRPEARREPSTCSAVPRRRSAPCHRGPGCSARRRHRLHRRARGGAGREPAGPAAAGRRHRRAGRGAVQRAPLAGAARPARPRARALSRRARAAHRGDRRRRPRRHHQRGDRRAGATSWRTTCRTRPSWSQRGGPHDHARR